MIDIIRNLLYQYKLSAMVVFPEGIVPNAKLKQECGNSHFFSLYIYITEMTPKVKPFPKFFSFLHLNNILIFLCSLEMVVKFL